jgi:uncharacterized repeat protein (TIGR02543 family)
MKHRQLRIAMIMLALLCCGIMGTGAKDTGIRFALVIGNSNYQNMTKLANPVNDATDIAAELSGYGFNVDLITDASLGEMASGVQRFVDSIEQSSKAEAALFYYAGHGVQFNGSNYLIPVNADIQSSYQLLDKTMGMNSVMRGLEQSGADFNLIILDACRDNPFSVTRGGDRGLSVMGTGGRGSMVVFATSPGDVAQDGMGRNSPFTGAFLQAMSIPGIEIRQLVTTVQRKVQEETGGRQVPWVNFSYTGEFYFQTVEEQLAQSQAELAAIQNELLSLEQEIAEREAAIEAAGSIEERRRLEAEQATTRALESAKQLEAQRIAEMERQAEEILASQAAQDVLRKEMDDRLASQAEALSRQAEQRKAELESLHAQQIVTDRSLHAKLETLAQYNRAISDIQLRYTELIQSTMNDLDTLYEVKIEAFRNENPQDPWETSAEHEDRLKGDLDALAAENENTKASQRNELERSMQQEIEPLFDSLKTAQNELQGKLFEVPMDNAKVHVGVFDAERKQFPITVSVQDGSVSFTQSLFYEIESRDREVLKSEYYRVYSAAQSEALVGQVAYRVFETESGMWTVLPEYIEVVNLLEGDTIISRAWERNDFQISSPVAAYRVNDTVRSISPSTLKQNLIVLGLPSDAEVYVNGTRQYYSKDTLFVGTADYSRVYLRVESPWIRRDVALRSQSVVDPGKIAYCDISDLYDPVGHLAIPRPDLKIELFKDKKQTIKIAMELSDEGYFSILDPGMYTITAQLPDDRYVAFTDTVLVRTGEKKVYDPGPVDLSALSHYEETIREQEKLRQALADRTPMKKLGWSTLGVGIAGIAGSVASYFLYTKAMENYDNAVLSTDLTRYRNAAELWSKFFTVNLAIGVVGGVAGGTVLALEAPKIRGLSEQIAEKERMEVELMEIMEAQKARDAMENFQGALTSIKPLDTSLIGSDVTLWFSLNGGKMQEPVERIIQSGSIIGTLPIPSKPGYSFGGWWTSLGSSGQVVNYGTRVGQSELFVMYAKWIPREYTVAFISNGGSAITPIEHVVYGMKIAKPETPVRSGSRFNGWYKEPEYSNHWDFNTDVVTDDITLYAKWTHVMSTESFSIPMRYVEGGSFQMGNREEAADERPVHTVVLDSFFIGIFEVTQDIYQQIMPNNPSNWKGSQLPVEQVSWYEAVKFCNLLSRRDGLEEVYWIDGTRVIANFQKRGYRLPTEAEWEYAARGGNESKGYLYAGSNLVDYVAWYKTNSDGKSHVVGSKESNELGLFDMSGNVWEWCSDWYGQYSTSKKTNPIGPTTGLNKVLRGGGWIIDDERVRTTYRFYNDPSSRYSHYGFRVVVPAI